ncbi:glycosyltransferase family 4 protein [Haloarcula hispanica]|uniref:Glycosyltransferase family 1 protein n=1 Tax=Haloarcula hispanica TaxID=51589 RepID=A0A482THP6_HALHI|nr:MULTISPECIES: glycosyltransferase family 4 protein [Haloarcula]KZX49224.1 glycosyl transferase family 1 [Haloarcula sp. K1]MCJ0619379.1 glycosyltransferase family 4 protein [Haloarcula hispanica]RYJ11559.1 glycosyltransferase family 1 protein [Haloarcula hispanica]
MRILRVAQNLYPEVPGGGTYHVHAMSRDQAAMGHDVTVLTVTDDESLPRQEVRNEYSVVRRAPTLEVFGNQISAGVSRFLRKAEDFDIIHAHSHLYFSTNLAAIQRRLGNIPLAITNHGLYSQNAPEWLFSLYLHTAGRWTFNQADVVFCYTEEDRERVRRFGVDSHIEVVPNGVDTDRFTPNGEVSDMINHDGPVVLFVGRLVEGKQPEIAADAVSRLPENLNVKLYVIGDGPLRSKMETNYSAVEFLGQVPYEKMPAMYRAGDVLILPSRAEGLPRTVLEAMSSGVPVVVSDLEQVAPVIDGAGVTVPVGDVDRFAAGIQTVLDGTIKNPQKVVDETFDWGYTVEQTTATLSELAGEFHR